MASDITQAVFGQPVTFTATVATVPASSLTPTGGTVSFSDGKTLLGSVTLINGTASLSTPLPVGTRYVTATYSGDGVNFSGGSSTNLDTISTRAGNGSHGDTGDGGPATNATLYAPDDVVGDAQGNLYIADTNNSVIRELKSNGAIVTIAGTGTAGYSGDGGPATKAQLNHPAGLALDPQGNLLIADSGNNVIRKVNLSGTITTMAGTGEAGYIGDDGPATSADLYDPVALAFDSHGNLFIADSTNNAVREINPSGTIATFSGTGSQGFGGDNGPAAKPPSSHTPAGSRSTPTATCSLPTQATTESEK